MKNQPYQTNNGLLILFETKNNNVVFASSDSDFIYNSLFKLEGDSELYIGREFDLDDKKYKIMNIVGYRDSQSSLRESDYLGGNHYKYTYVMRVIVEPT